MRMTTLALFLAGFLVANPVVNAGEPVDPESAKAISALEEWHTRTAPKREPTRLKFDATFSNSIWETSENRPGALWILDQHNYFGRLQGPNETHHQEMKADDAIVGQVEGKLQLSLFLLGISRYFQTAASQYKNFDPYWAFVDPPSAARDSRKARIVYQSQNLLIITLNHSLPQQAMGWGECLLVLDRDAPYPLMMETTNRQSEDVLRLERREQHTIPAARYHEELNRLELLPFDSKITDEELMSAWHRQKQSRETQ